MNISNVDMHIAKKVDSAKRDTNYVLCTVPTKQIKKYKLWLSKAKQRKLVHKTIVKM